MPAKKNQETKKAVEKLGEMLRTFGDTLGEIFDDPDVKEKAKALASSVVDAAAKVVEDNVKAEEARAKFRNVGKAAKTLGNSLETHFTANPQ